MKRMLIKMKDSLFDNEIRSVNKKERDKSGKYIRRNPKH